MERRGEDRRESERKGHKRKLADADVDVHRSSKKQSTDVDGYRGLSRSEVRGHIDVLKRCVSSSKADRSAAWRAARTLGEMAMQEENIGLLVEEGAAGILVKHLQAPSSVEADGSIPYEYEVEKEAAFAIGLLAGKPEHQRLLIEAGALRPLVSLLQKKVSDTNTRMVNGAVRRAADAVSNLARDNKSVQSRLRAEGVVAFLEGLLESSDRKVQRAASDALKSIVARNEESKTESYQRNGSKEVAEPPQTSVSQQKTRGDLAIGCGLRGTLVEISIKAKGEAKGHVLKLIKLSQAEFDLPKACVGWVSKNFRLLDPWWTPRTFGALPIITFREGPLEGENARKVQLFNGEKAIMKYGAEEEDARKIIKELCVHHHLKDLEGSRIPRLLFCGTWEARGSLPFFFFTELYEPILEPSQVSASELSDLLNLIHGRGVLLGCTNKFPRLARVDSNILLVDMPTAIFEHRRSRFKAELKLLVGLCGEGD